MFWKKANLDQLLTLKTPKLGPVTDSTTYIYIYICGKALTCFAAKVVTVCELQDKRFVPLEG